jgi:hypothetical protein
VRDSMMRAPCAKESSLVHLINVLKHSQAVSSEGGCLFFTHSPRKQADTDGMPEIVV